MTGIDFGFGSLIGLSLLFLVLVPLVTILLMNQITCFLKMKCMTKTVVYGVVFIFLGYMTVILIRKFHVSSFKFLLSYIILITLLIFIVTVVNKTKQYPKK